MTIIGGLFFVLFTYFLVFRRDQFLVCVAVAMAVPDSAFLIIRGVGVSPYYVSLIILSVLSLVAFVRPTPAALSGPRNRWTPMGVLSVALVVYTVLLTIGAPSWFAGLPIVSPRISGTNEAGAVFTPLSFTDSNIAQLGYFLLNLGLVFYVARAHRRESALNMLMIGLGVGVVLALSISAYETLVSYDVHGIFDNSPRNFYATELSETRLRGQFSEPSHLAAFATAALAFMLAMARSKRGAYRVVSLVGAGMSALCLIGSGAGTAAIAILPLAVLYVLGAIIRIISTWRISPWLIVALPAAVGVATLAIPKAVQVATELVSTKLDSISYVIRAPQDANAWEVLWRTNGLGVGLGSNRSSSLAMMMLSTVGVVGFAMLVVLLASVIYAAARNVETRPAAWAALAFVTCAVISLADFTNPVLWMAVSACYAEYKRRQVAPEESARSMLSSWRERPPVLR